VRTADFRKEGLRRAYPARARALGGEPLGLPINVRLYRKGGKSHTELAEDMIGELADWLPHRRFHLCADGAYACLAGRGLPRTHFTSRLRRDAALFEKAPPRQQGRRGRPRKKGRRLPTPEQIAARLTPANWQRTVIDMRGHRVDRLLYSRPVLWYHTCPDHLVRLVIVRDPEGTQPDDFFFTTDLAAAASPIEAGVRGQVSGVRGSRIWFWRSEALTPGTRHLAPAPSRQVSGVRCPVSGEAG
jgi:hypothetical protein